MDKSVTVSLKGVVLAGLGLVVLLAAYLIGTAGHPSGSTAQAAAETESAPHRLTMVGVGETTAVPDQVSFTVAVKVVDPQLETALDESSGTMDQVFAALKGFGVTKRDMQTTGLSMDPVYEYPTYGPPVLKGYRVTQSARITIDELAAAGRAIAASVGTGGNRVRVNDIRLGISDPEAVLGRARRAAVEQAGTKAEEYAEASGQELGDVVDLKEVSGNPHAVAVPQLAYRAELDAAKAVPIRAGESDLKVRVRVVWELE
ncbi:SIMPL domain-containing protein [Nocardioides sp. JQ2195]|uniref:SIMPL domain-containing protein n=1 Tax=Nocardioides sp. JQ2195 TaxID=2592334 RepID=UPI00143E856E|nr:SIMPL domain-containing protein [Nocardioides sp. JQ2195]QIX26889.1 SIMPL domain-containing protein [Nocardioides sp. JQ2195]